MSFLHDSHGLHNGFERTNMRITLQFFYPVPEDSDCPCHLQ